MAYLVKLAQGSFEVLSDDSFNRLMTKKKKVWDFVKNQQIEFFDVDDWVFIGESSNFIKSRGQKIWNLLENEGKTDTNNNESTNKKLKTDG